MSSIVKRATARISAHSESVAVRRIGHVEILDARADDGDLPEGAGPELLHEPRRRLVRPRRDDRPAAREIGFRRVGGKLLVGQASAPVAHFKYWLMSTSSICAGSRKRSAYSLYTPDVRNSLNSSGSMWASFFMKDMILMLSLNFFGAL